MNITGTVNTVTFVLTFAGAISWGLVGGFDYNIVTTLFGVGTTLTTVMYVLIGVSGIYSAIVYFKHSSECKK